MRSEATGDPEQDDDRGADPLVLGSKVTPLRAGDGRRRIGTARSSRRAPALRERPHNLPALLTSFVGRERQIAEVVQLVGTSRLVTLAGPPGVGKTRLALQVAETIRDEYADGVWLVELAPLAEPTLVPSVVAGALGLREEAGRPTLEALADYLQRRHVLLVLDNCEHLVDACAALGEALLMVAPELRILTTSREPLGLIGEVAWRVPSLTLPTGSDGAGRTPSEDAASGDPVAALLQSEAGRLFVERARAARPGFDATEANAAALARLCARLDGIPLAIELAAARVRALAPAQIAERLGDRFALLTRGSRTALPRQRTLRALVDWSHDLLSASERVLLRRLAIFAGGWSLEAAEAVAGVGYWGLGAGESVPSPPTPSTQHPTPVLDLLQSLVEKSLVMAEDGQDGQVRYRLLETLREYGLEQLEASGEAEVIAWRHADYFVALAERADMEQFGPDQVAWLDRLEREHDNLRAALRWSAEAGDVETGFRLGGALWHFWAARGHVTEGRGRLAALMSEGRGHTSTVLGAKVLAAAGILALEVGDHREARSLLTQSLDVARAAEDRAGTARALNGLGRVAHRVGDYATARALGEESVATYRALGDKAGIADALHSLAFFAYVTRHDAEAQALGEENLALRRELGDKRGIARAVHNLALSAVYHRGDLATARRYYEESLQIFRELGHRAGVAMALDNLRDVLVLQEDYDAASACQTECLEIASELGDLLRITLSIDGGAMMAAVRGQPARAVRLAAAAEELRKRLDLALEPPWIALFEPKLDAARAALGPASASVWAEGAAMSLEQAVAYALEMGPAEGGPAAGLGAAESGGPAVGPGPDGLTPREWEIARLVGRGLSNRQIAEALVVSRRTAEWHVGNLLDKLGLDSRAGLAAWAAERGLAGDTVR